MHRPFVPILMYHRVTSEDLTPYSEHSETLRVMAVSVESFASQMAWLARRGFRTISLDNLLEARANNRSLPRKPVIITFDDGYQDVADNAIPILEQHNFMAHLFLIPGLVGRTSEWDVREYGWAFHLFDWETARNLEERGFRCEAHTMTHPRLTLLETDECRREIEESRYALIQELGREVSHFAYPFGAYDRDTELIVHDAGFASACSTNRGLSSSTDNPYALRRLCIHLDDELFDFKCNVLTGIPIRGGVRRKFSRILSRLTQK